MKRIFIILSLISAILISQRPVIIGDINGDFSVDVLDIVGLVTIILGGTEPEINEFVAGDINFDGSLDVLDIVELVTSIIMPPDCPDNFDNCSNVPDQCCDINHESAYLQCEDCHILDYINTESPNHLEQFFPHSDCNICHMATGWQDILFQHTILDVSCNICHLADLQVANQLVNQHNTLSSNCDICHTTQTWPELDFLHEVTGFVLEGLHEGLACNSCHESSWLAVTDECSTCHQPDWEFTTEPIHSEQIFHPEDCIDCHDAYGWIPSIFEHDLPQQAPCSSCHIADFDNANILEPDHQNFTTDCQICHVSTQWNNVNFDHNSTEFPLVGSHQTANCEGCHSEGYTDIETTCENCHLDDYDLTENPDHTVQTFLSADCEDCHTAVNWTDIIFEHGLPEQAECSTCHDANYQATETPIHSDEVYEAADCELCHNNDAWSPSIFVHLPEETTCNICHTANLDTANLNIGGHLGFGENCIDCHQSTQWQEILFDHSTTGFLLVDSHDGPLCGDCHGVEDTPTLCQGCHLDDYDLTETPVHSVQTFLSADCENCHTAVNWTDIIFEHGLPEQAECSTCHDANYQATESPIHSDEVYEAGDCELCHNNDAWSPSIFVHLPEETTCNICHTANLDTANVNIGGHLGFGENCIDCHQSTQWQEIIFDHSTTDFPLIDSHDGPLCGDCHDVGVPPTVCESCHFEEFVATENPDHQTQIFLSSDCEFCHSAVNWLDIIYDHGLPEQAACSTCHDADLQIANTNVTDHLGFPSDCTVCHLATNWTEITFDHSQTEFPLDGAHQSSECSNCHVEGYVDLPTDCGYCHLDEYNQTQNPNHLTAIYPLAECESCHNAEAWAPDIYSHLPDVESCNICHLADLIDANTTILGHSELPNNCTLCHATELWDDLSPFDHSLTAFELEGSHLEVDCLICHDSGFSLTATECYVCHTAEYDNTTEPIHITQIYPADDCEYCHSAVDWLPEIFDHLMPVSTSCSVCHLTEWDGANLTVPNHESYGDLCEICHTPDNWEAEVDHSFENTGFELEGLHLAVSCNGCHPNGLGNNGEVRDCASSDCHITDYDNSNENHHYNVPSGGFPSNYCELCHNAVNENFSPSIFIHELNNDDCNFCHQFDYDNAIQPNHSPIGYVDDCSTCHETVAWQGVDPHAISGTDCSDCHNYSGNYNDPVPNIDHNSAPKLGNSIDNCEICHTSTNSWSSLNFGASRHDGSIYQIYFDIYSNDHQGEWDNSCTNNCHVNGDFDSYSCYEGCHEHSQTGMLNEHCEDGPCANCSGSNGYWNIGFINYTNGSWTNPATFVQCYGCHPDGDKDGPCGDD
ncbi:MAG: hypothetical protein HOM08_01580 [Candidatus Marinimicrobia bacterium]|nr:hypothetical protein [Candidatus Neomarinimicrobiota bacterium]MBT5539375.1 hypothetical protein [Candidatus Neomarinimicrobiota bacterium]